MANPDCTTLSNPSPSCTRIVLPDISKYTRQHFDLKCNPFYQVGETASEAWFDSYGILSGTRLEKFFGCRLCLLASLCFPDADLDHLRPGMGSFLWIFAFDDMADLGELNPEEWQRAVDMTMNTLHNPDEVQPKLKIVAALQSIFQRMRQNGNSTAIRHFVEATESYTRAITQDMADHHAGHVQTFEEFRKYRRDTSGVKVTLATLEYAHEINIPDEVLHDPIVSELSLAGNEILTWANDVYSFPKEYAQGQTHNLVFVLMWNNQLGLQDAMNRAGELIEQRVQDYLVAKAQVPSFGPHLDHEVSRYIQGIEYCVQACIDWSFMNTRYFGANAEEVKRDRVVELDPQVKFGGVARVNPEIIKAVTMS
ncbi:unnamed protein product [Rhizoctonia solani]|uniref:Terpene synthase n=1 Tax=Rhizoctonia solani TaxID=456999 RepID=A0A8H3EFA4_9AGAM|nr:unnamed protein product [Rhizoctonia solani]